MRNYIREYWDQIESGDVVVSRRVRQQLERLIRDLDNPPDPWIFDLERANRPIEFIERFCQQSKGRWIGQPLRLQLFQKARIQATYGFVHKDTGLRRYREVLTLIGRKNGKSTEKAALGLYMTTADNEGGAEVYPVATKRDQAKIVWSEASNMVRQSPALSAMIKRRKTDLYFPLTFSKFEPLSADSKTMDGLNTHYGIIDELHAIKDRNLYDVIKQSMSARQQPLIDIITTAGFVRESIYDSLYEYACGVLDGDIDDPRFLAFLYELDDRSEWTDYRAWEKANPGLGTIKDVETLAEHVERARKEPDFLPTVLTKDFNIRETTAGAWLTFDQVDNPATFDIEEIRDSYAVSGTDLSSTTDLSCATLLVMKPGDPTKYVIQQYFLPADVLHQRVKEDKIPYDRWAERGLVRLCPGNKIDYSMITAWYIEMLERYGIRPMWNGYDPWNSQYWVDEMRARGFNMIEIRQGPKTLSQPMKEMAADLAAKRVNYNNNPVLKWCLTNTAVKRDDNDNIRPVKGPAQRRRIDGAVSLIIAYATLFQHYSDYQALI